MIRKYFQKLSILWITLFVAFSGCADLKNYHPSLQYRPDITACPIESAFPEADDCCNSYALQRYENDDQGYLLGFVEFDEQGQLFDRNQMNTVLNELEQKQNENDLLMVVYVHGWHNNADPSNLNLIEFRRVLTTLAKQDSHFRKITISNKVESPKPRRIAGVYVGWRGDSISQIDVPVIGEATFLPILAAQQATFWDRKNTAHKVGHAGLTELLLRLEHIKKERSQLYGDDNTKLVTIGHSFGGAAVFSALSQIMAHGFVNTSCPKGVDSQTTLCNVYGFGNLVVLINPAMEAQQFSVLHDMSMERGSYFPGQLPVLAVLASETDFPVKSIFPLGRWFSTLFEKTINVEDKANREALGHFTPYNSYRLADGACPDKEKKAITANSGTDTAGKDFTLNFLKTTSPDWDSGEPQIRFSGEEFAGCLTRNLNVAPRNPYLIISVDKAIIDGHNNLRNQKLRQFIKGLVLLGNQKPTVEERQNTRLNALSIK